MHLLWEQGVAGSNPATPTGFREFFLKQGYSKGYSPDGLYPFLWP